MAYVINDKVYSDHPLMDEMVYNLDKIMKYIEVKNQVKADTYETEESVQAANIYLAIKDENLTFISYPFSKAELIDYGFSESEADDILAGNVEVSDEDKDGLIAMVSETYIENYVEKNNYYRALLGLPWLDEDYDEDYYYVYIDSSYISDSSLHSQFDFSLPLHEYNSDQIALLETLEVMDTIREEYSDYQYKYLNFLGDKSCDLYTIRKASNYDILYLPSTEDLVEVRFRQIFETNRIIYLNRYYSEAQAYMSDYYEEIMIIMLIVQTYTDMIVDVPEWYIRRDVFDLRSCKYFLSSHGIEYFKDIPLKYQINIVKNMNKLIKYKSTDKNFNDIISLFTNEDVDIYRHYIFKKRLTDSYGNYISSDDVEDMYDLKFVKSKIGDTFDNYIKDSIYVLDYDEITLYDKWWDGLDEHETVRINHLEKDFTIEGTKYYSVDQYISFGEYTYQVEYFFSLLFNSNTDISDIRISIPTISSISSFSLTDIFVLLYCLTANYEGYSLTISYPDGYSSDSDDEDDDSDSVDKPEFTPYQVFDGGGVTVDESEEYEDIDGMTPSVQRKYRRPINSGERPEMLEITRETFYDWLRWKYPYLWIDIGSRVKGFNASADLTELEELINFLHSTYQWEGSWDLDSLGISSFITPVSISSIDELIEVYETNYQVYQNLEDLIINAQSRDEKVLFQFVMNYLFTSEFDMSFYETSDGELVSNYDELLKNMNYILYLYYKDITEEADQDTREDLIRQAMNDIITNLEYYLNTDSLKYIFSMFSITSFQSLLNYIYELVNFFKSWKVYIIDPYVTYILDDKMENSLLYVDQMEEIKPIWWKRDALFMRDSEVYTNTSFEFEDTLYHRTLETMDIFGRYDPDVDNIDYELYGGLADTTEFEGEYDGGGVTIGSTAPNHEYNGGRVLGTLDWLDFDGGTPSSDMTDAPDIDGMNVINSRYVGSSYNRSRPIYTDLETLISANVKHGNIRTDIDPSTLTIDDYGDPKLHFPYIIDGGVPFSQYMANPEPYIRVEDSQHEEAPMLSVMPHYIYYSEDSYIARNALYSVNEYIGIGGAFNWYNRTDNYRTFFNEYVDKVYWETISNMKEYGVFVITANFLGYPDFSEDDDTTSTDDTEEDSSDTDEE